MREKILFILKRRGTSYGGGSSPIVPKPALKSSGLLNSARFVHEMLLRNHVRSHLVEVVDNNQIDAEVTKYRPTHVIIEAIWVVPEKFNILRKLHPDVKWIIRCHSETPFLAGEGISFEWFFRYMEQENVVMSFNTKKTTDEFRMLYALSSANPTVADVASKVVFLPNYYPVARTIQPYRLDNKLAIDVGCFGAIRPMKNHVLQAVAAIDFAARRDMDLRFHVNSTRIEGNADAHKKNLVSLFAGINSPQFQLIEHPWMSHIEFTNVVRQMDIGLQMSFTESFNIVTADFVNAGIPVVTSSEIEWVSSLFHADTTDSHDIVRVMDRALFWKKWLYPFIDRNRGNLKVYSRNSAETWLEYFCV